MSWLSNFFRGDNDSDDDNVSPPPLDRFLPPQTNSLDRMDQMESGASPPHPAHRNPTEEEKAAQEKKRNSPRPPKNRRPKVFRIDTKKNKLSIFNRGDAPNAINSPLVPEEEQQVVPISRMRSIPDLSTLAAAGAGEENSTTFRPIGFMTDVIPRANSHSPVSPPTLSAYSAGIVEGNEEIARNRSPKSRDIGWSGGRWNNLRSLGRRTKRSTKRSTKRTKRTKRSTKRTKRSTKRRPKRRTRRRRSA